MSVLARVVRALARLLPDDERVNLGLELGERVNDPHAETATPPEPAADGMAPDWTYVWNALLDTSAHAFRIEELLEDERAFFSFDTIRQAAGQLRDQIDDAYNLMCVAPWLDDLRVNPGDHLEAVREQVDLRRADIVDTEIAPMRPEPDPNAPTWTIRYRVHGGFVATTSQAEDGANPWRIWGTAPTAQSAAHTLTWYFLDRPPAIELDTPPNRWPWARGGPKADLSGEGLMVKDLLNQRGPMYDQHIASCRTVHKILRHRDGDLKEYLDERAAELNATDPQLAGQHDILDPIDLPLNRDHYGFANTVQWVPTRLVVATDHRTWGDFGGHRDYVPKDIIEALRDSDDLDVFTYKLFCDEINVLRTPAWAGPLYRIGANGNHRIHTARILNLPWLAASVHLEATPPAWDMIGLISADPRNTADLRQPFEQRLQDRAVLIAGLIRRGVIDGTLANDGPRSVLHCRRLPAPWLLRGARYATTMNTVYESRYPGALKQLGIPTTIGTDADAWTHWLTSK